MEDTQTAIRRFIIREIMFEEDESVLSFDDSLLEDGIIDSAKIIDLVLFLEREFGVSIDLSDLVPENFQSVRAVSSLLKMST